MSEKFTQGEWLVDNCYTTMLNITAHDIEVCEIDCRYEVSECGNSCEINPTDEELANAHLISQAPAMYRMLDTIAQRMQETNSGSIGDMLTIELLLKKARGE